MEIIDTHVHIYPPERQYKLIKWIKKSFPEHSVRDNVTPEEIMKDLEGFGISRMINLVYPLSPDETESLNEFNSNLCKSYDNIHGFASILPQNKEKEIIIKKAFYDLGLIGLKFHPFIQRIDIRDPAMEEVWDICEESDRPVFLHTGYETFYNRKLKPACVRDILNRHPELNLVISHACFPDLHSAFQMARDFAGVYIDLTNVPGSIPYFQANFGGKNLRSLLLEGIKEFRGRVFFGTDHPVGMGSVEEIFNQFQDLNLDNNDYSILTYEAADSFLEKFKV